MLRNLEVRAEKGLKLALPRPHAAGSARPPGSCGSAGLHPDTSPSRRCYYSTGACDPSPPPRVRALDSDWPSPGPIHMKEEVSRISKAIVSKCVRKREKVAA